MCELTVWKVTIKIADDLQEMKIFGISSNAYLPSKAAKEFLFRKFSDKYTEQDFYESKIISAEEVMAVDGLDGRVVDTVHKMRELELLKDLGIDPEKEYTLSEFYDLIDLDESYRVQFIEFLLLKDHNGEPYYEYEEADGDYRIKGSTGVTIMKNHAHELEHGRDMEG